MPLLTLVIAIALIVLGLLVISIIFAISVPIVLSDPSSIGGWFALLTGVFLVLRLGASDK